MHENVGQAECFGDQCFVTYNNEPTVPPNQPPSSSNQPHRIEDSNTNNEHSITPLQQEGENKATPSDITVPSHHIANPSPIQDIQLITSHVSNIALSTSTPTSNHDSGMH